MQGYIFGNDYIIFNHHFNNIFTEDLLNTLRIIKQVVIRIHEDFDFLNKLPDNIETIHIDSTNFNQPIDCLPSKLKRLKISSKKFCQPLDDLPTGIKEIVIYGSYNLPLDLLPSSLELLDLTLSSFNQPVNFLPYGLKKIFLSFCFNQTIDYLPDSVEEIYIGYCGNGYGPTLFNQSINRFPKRLKYMEINFYEKVKINSKISNSFMVKQKSNNNIKIGEPHFFYELSIKE